MSHDLYYILSTISGLLLLFTSAVCLYRFRCSSNQHQGPGQTDVVLQTVMQSEEEDRPQDGLVDQLIFADNPVNIVASRGDQVTLMCNTSETEDMTQIIWATTCLYRFWRSSNQHQKQAQKVMQSEEEGRPQDDVVDQSFNSINVQEID
ncbi:hypothetical protein WMY93_002582 [Mugilogobius chulae]|uniref:Ig-like domain-containing protein n=1 Tax=Mugilogobius chulae TaxID=88201 RepID=A0AAW0Q028_9GOBI